MAADQLAETAGAKSPLPKAFSRWPAPIGLREIGALATVQTLPVLLQSIPIGLLANRSLRHLPAAPG